MQLEAILLADYAADYGGKLSITGTFDTLWTPGFPFKHPFFTFVAKVRYVPGEEGKHRYQIRLINPIGSNVIKPLEGDFDLIINPEEGTASTNFCLTIGGAEFEKEGKYEFQLNIDGKNLGKMPLYVRLKQA